MTGETIFLKKDCTGNRRCSLFLILRCLDGSAGGLRSGGFLFRIVLCGKLLVSDLAHAFPRHLVDDDGIDRAGEVVEFRDVHRLQFFNHGLRALVFFQFNIRDRPFTLDVVEVFDTDDGAALDGFVTADEAFDLVAEQLVPLGVAGSR